MECPRCQAELSKVPNDDLALQKCEDCSSIWIDVSDLNRMLIHNNLTGLESLGGKMAPEALTGQCSDCLVDLLRVSGGTRHDPQHYDTCDGCGGVFLESEFDAEDVPGIETQIVAFFRSFGGKKQSALGG